MERVIQLRRTTTKLLRPCQSEVRYCSLKNFPYFGANCHNIFFTGATRPNLAEQDIQLLTHKDIHMLSSRVPEWITMCADWLFHLAARVKGLEQKEWIDIIEDEWYKFLANSHCEVKVAE